MRTLYIVVTFQKLNNFCIMKWNSGDDILNRVLRSLPPSVELLGPKIPASNSDPTHNPQVFKPGWRLCSAIYSAIGERKSARADPSLARDQGLKERDRSFAWSNGQKRRSTDYLCLCIVAFSINTSKARVVGRQGMPCLEETACAVVGR